MSRVRVRGCTCPPKANLLARNLEVCFLGCIMQPITLQRNILVTSTCVLMFVHSITQITQFVPSPHSHSHTCPIICTRLIWSLFSASSSGSSGTTKTVAFRYRCFIPPGFSSPVLRPVWRGQMCMEGSICPGSNRLELRLEAKQMCLVRTSVRTFFVGMMDLGMTWYDCSKLFKAVDPYNK